MAKHRDKKKKNAGAGAAAMDIVPDHPADAPQAMDTSEGNISNHALKPVSGWEMYGMLEGAENAEKKPSSFSSSLNAKPPRKEDMDLLKKATTIRRSKNLKRRKAMSRAISNIEKSAEKVSKSKSKVLRVQLAKSLYD